MVNGRDVLEFLLPEGGWVINGDTFEGIEFIEATPITKEEFDAGFALVDAWKEQAETAKAAARQAILDRLGLTADEAALLLGAN
jgi:hypothetical protein